MSTRPHKHIFIAKKAYYTCGNCHEANPQTRASYICIGHACRIHLCPRCYPNHHPHALKKAQGQSWTCDVCRGHSNGGLRYRCQRCDYDECLNCIQRRSGSGGR